MSYSRKEFFVDGMAVTALGLSAAYGFKVGEHSNEFRSLDHDLIRQEVSTILPSVRKIDQESRLNNQSVALALMTLAHMHGGDPLAARVIDVVNRRKLFIGEFQSEMNGIYGKFDSPLDTKFGLTIRLKKGVENLYQDNPGLFDVVLWHELFHAIQYADNPEVKSHFDFIGGVNKLIVAPITLSAVAGRMCETLIQYFIPENPYDYSKSKFSRRNMLIRSAGVAAAAATLFTGTSHKLAMPILNYISPDEAQAYIQTGVIGLNNSIDGQLTSQFPAEYRKKLII